jgi:hypothetical protein
MLQRIKNIILKKKGKRKGSLVSNITNLWKRSQRFVHQNWITIVSSLLSVGLCSFILYMLLSPLPELPVPDSQFVQTIDTDTIKKENWQNHGSATRRAAAIFGHQWR